MKHRVYAGVFYSICSLCIWLYQAICGLSCILSVPIEAANAEL